jgi:hypothetical protein
MGQDVGDMVPLVGTCLTNPPTHRYGSARLDDGEITGGDDCANGRAGLVDLYAASGSSTAFAAVATTELGSWWDGLTTDEREGLRLAFVETIDVVNDAAEV